MWLLIEVLTPKSFSSSSSTMITLFLRLLGYVWNLLAWAPKLLLSKATPSPSSPIFEISPDSLSLGIPGTTAWFFIEGLFTNGYIGAGDY
jgi:hypothetical protein